MSGDAASNVPATPQLTHRAEFNSPTLTCHETLADDVSKVYMRPGDGSAEAYYDAVEKAKAELKDQRDFHGQLQLGPDGQPKLRFPKFQVDEKDPPVVYRPTADQLSHLPLVSEGAKLETYADCGKATADADHEPLIQDPACPQEVISTWKRITDGPNGEYRMINVNRADAVTPENTFRTLGLPDEPLHDQDDSDDDINAIHQAINIRKRRAANPGQCAGKRYRAMGHATAERMTRRICSGCSTTLIRGGRAGKVGMQIEGYPCLCFWCYMTLRDNAWTKAEFKDGKDRVECENGLRLDEVNLLQALKDQDPWYWANNLGEIALGSSHLKIQVSERPSERVSEIIEID